MEGGGGEGGEQRMITQIHTHKHAHTNIIIQLLIGMLPPPKRANTSGVGKSNNNHYEDIYIHVPPYSNTH